MQNKLVLFNLSFGFFLMSLAASAGFFIAMDKTQAILLQENQAYMWQLTLQSSAHGHTSLFGMLHVMFGLTLFHSPLSFFWKKLQTGGLVLGSIAMSGLLAVRSFEKPSPSLNFLGFVIGGFLTAALCTLLSHAIVLFWKFSRKTLHE